MSSHSTTYCPVSISWWNITVPEIYVARPSGPMPHPKREYKISTSPVQTQCMKCAFSVILFSILRLFFHWQEKCSLSDHFILWEKTERSVRAVIKDYLHRRPIQTKSCFHITLILRLPCWVNGTSECRLRFHPHPNYAPPAISFYWLGGQRWSWSQVFKYKIPGHQELQT